MTELPIARLSFAAIDFESSGAAPGETDMPIQVGMLRAPSLFEPAELFCSYLACEHPVRWVASRKHGITTADLKGAPSMLSLWTTFRHFLGGAVVVGHNPSTERRFLRVFPAHGFGPWLDTLALARHCLPTLRDLTLASVCEALAVVPAVDKTVPGKTWHDALYDAAASLEVLRMVVQTLQLHDRPLRTLSFALKSYELAG